MKSCLKKMWVIVLFITINSYADATVCENLNGAWKGYASSWGDLICDWEPEIIIFGGPDQYKMIIKWHIGSGSRAGGKCDHFKTRIQFSCENGELNFPGWSINGKAGEDGIRISNLPRKYSVLHVQKAKS